MKSRDVRDVPDILVSALLRGLAGIFLAGVLTGAGLTYLLLA